jgi:hypothetical protein
MTRREQETRRRRRVRAEALARAEREYAVGRPLVDASKPIIGGDAAHHEAILERELLRRAELLMAETLCLATYFAKGCWVVAAERQQMLDDFVAWHVRYGHPYVKPTHSTLSSAAPTTIPAV